jgi:hypothetical protein
VERHLETVPVEKVQVLCVPGKGTELKPGQCHENGIFWTGIYRGSGEPDNKKIVPEIAMTRPAMG